MLAELALLDLLSVERIVLIDPVGDRVTEDESGPDMGLLTASLR